MKISARKTAFEILLKIEKDKAYSNLALENNTDLLKLGTRDRSFVSALVYGVTERLITLDYELSLYLTKSIAKLKPDVRCILRLGAYQILFMDKVPQSAAVNESVKLAKEKCSYAASLVNAVLHKICSSGLVLPENDSSSDFLSVKYSCPVWLINKWKKDYGEENTVGILETSFGGKSITVRVNSLFITREELIEIFKSEGVDCKSGDIPYSIEITSLPGSIDSLDSFKKGLFHVQDKASQLCALSVEAKPGETVFDLCSAPGGKTFTIAQTMNNNGTIKAFDIYEHRTALIEKGAERLGINIVNAAVADAGVYNKNLGLADRVLCDVPCSGLGIIRQKPEIKYKNPDELKSLPEIQLKILTNGSNYVKPLGRLIYSTCSLSRAENEKVCERFLASNEGFKLISERTYMPHKDNCDGFFVAVFEKEGNE